MIEDIEIKMKILAKARIAIDRDEALVGFRFVREILEGIADQHIKRLEFG